MVDSVDLSRMFPFDILSTPRWGCILLHLYTLCCHFWWFLLDAFFLLSFSWIPKLCWSTTQTISILNYSKLKLCVEAWVPSIPGMSQFTTSCSSDSASFTWSLGASKQISVVSEKPSGYGSKPKKDSTKNDLKIWGSQGLQSWPNQSKIHDLHV
jgi:hypothetical protein